MLEETFKLSYAPLIEKVGYINKAISKLDAIKFFSQIAWEGKLIATNRYADLSKDLEEIGRQFGGWKKGLLIKTLTNSDERK